MTTEKILSPGYYTLKQLTIQSVVGESATGFDGVRSLDISNLVPSLTITTSINSHTLHGSMAVLDGVGVLEKFPLRGEERAIMVIEDSLQNTYEYDVFFYKIDGVSTSDENGVLAYTVHFVSYQSFFAGKNKIIKAFKEVTVSSIVEELFAQYYAPRRSARPSDRGATPDDRVQESSNKNIIVAPTTDGTIRCTIPNMDPASAMSFLSKRAYSTTSPSCSFRFFENSRSYYFVSDEQLFDISEDRNKLFEFTYYDSIPKTPEFFDKQMDNLNTLVNTRRVNTIDDMYGGAYRSKVLVLDIVNGTTNLMEPGYSYSDSKGSYFQEPNENVEDRHTDQFIDTYFNEEVQKRFIVVKDFMDDAGNADATLNGNMHYADIISNKLAYRKHLESITVSASGPGRLDITAGDIVNLIVPEFTTEEGQQETNKQLSGKYIVVDLSHIMDMETMTNQYTLMKRDWTRVDGGGNLGRVRLPSNPIDTFFDGGVLT